jgi:hypothetical protein
MPALTGERPNERGLAHHAQRFAGRREQPRDRRCGAEFALFVG